MSRLRRSALTMLASAPLALSAAATPVFGFDVDAQGWINQPTEPFAVSHTATGGVGGGGGLSVSATVPRDSYQIVRAPDGDWSAIPNAYAAISFDILLGAGVQLRLATTGLQIRDDTSNVSNVYLASFTMTCGATGAWVIFSQHLHTHLPRMCLSTVNTPGW